MKTIQEIIKENIEKYQVAIMSQRANDMTKACMEAWSDQEKRVLKDRLIEKVKNSHLTGLSKATVYAMITQL